MRKLLLTLSLIAASSSLYKCTQVEYVETPRVEPVFSEQAQEWGELFAETLTATAKEVRKQKIKLTDRNSIFAVSQNVTWNTLEHRGLVTANDRVSFANARTSGEAEEPVALAGILDSEELTDAQKVILERIEDARAGSRSYIEFSNSLASINNEIPTSVPEEEQALLFSITSALFYGLEAMNELVGEGLLPGNPEKGNITLAQLKLGFPSAMASGESGGSSWWSDWGKGFTGAVVGTAITGGLGAAGGAVTIPMAGIGAVPAWVAGFIGGGLLGGIGYLVNDIIT